MVFSWDESRRAFADAAEWFVRTTALVGDRWDRPGLGEWDVRALVGHASRALLTVETYLAAPAEAVEITSPVAYYRATKAASASPAVAARGRDAGTALGTDPRAAVAEIAARVRLPTRTFELAVHTADLATALGLPPDVPALAAAQALELVASLAVAEGIAGPLLLAVTGRPGPAGAFSVL